MNGLLIWSGAGALAWPGLLILSLAAAWTLHVWRLRVRERDLLSIVDQRTRSWRQEMEAHAALRQRVQGPAMAGLRVPGAAAACAAPGQPRERSRDPLSAAVLAVTSASEREDLLSRLGGIGVEVAVADSPWSAYAACRDAFEAGRPYNLVLLDATLPELQEPGGPARLQAQVEAWGTRVAVMRAKTARTRTRSLAAGAGRAGDRRPGGRESHTLEAGACSEEGIGSDENPDRRGRGGFAPAAAADAPAVGLRSRRGD